MESNVTLDVDKGYFLNTRLKSCNKQISKLAHRNYPICTSNWSIWYPWSCGIVKTHGSRSDPKNLLCLGNDLMYHPLHSSTWQAWMHLMILMAFHPMSCQCNRKGLFLACNGMRNWYLWQNVRKASLTSLIEAAKNFSQLSSEGEIDVTKQYKEAKVSITELREDDTQYDNS